MADALRSVGLADAAGAYPWQLSGGMQQRVGIARSLAYEPRVLLMDEPFAAVDAQTRAGLEDLVRRLWRERGITILFVTHDIDEAVYLGERVVVLSASPTVVREQLKVDLPDEHDQLHTRVTPRFGELRTHVYEQIQAAKRGAYTLWRTRRGRGSVTRTKPRRGSTGRWVPARAASSAPQAPAALTTAGAWMSPPSVRTPLTAPPGVHSTWVTVRPVSRRAPQARTRWAAARAGITWQSWG